MLVLGLAACQVDIEVGIGFNEDGSGLVTVDVALDEEAVALAPDITSLLLIDDIEDPASGWSYNDPRIDEEGRTSFSASKPFGSPEQLESVLAEIFGADDVFRDFTFERATSFAQTDYRVTGVVDLSKGMDLFTDPQLTERLGGEPLGQPIPDLAAAQAGVAVRLVLDLPVGAEQEETLELGQGAVGIEMTAQEESGTALTLRWVAWAAFALLGLSVLIAVAGYLLERRNRRRSTDPTVAQEPVVRSTSSAAAQPPARRLRLVVLNPLGVLFEPPDEPSRLLASFAAERGSEVDDESVEQLYNQAVLGRVTPAELWVGLGLNDDPTELSEQYLDQYTVRSGARDFVAEMARRELPVACITNDIASWSSALRDRLQITGVDTWIVSSEVGVCMPAPGIYEALRRTTAVSYENALLVDVRSGHLDAAHALGMSTALLADSRPQEEEAPSHAVVTSFSDFFRRRPRA
ncbi:HAD family hydrolase [Candidatus Poriferisocius sp.]|uniref:HAD family hydrolase n=1 Tax=Candidatus Poriferisocius sp. TaxID=3101276 RepID=UPI003B0191D6